MAGMSTLHACDSTIRPTKAMRMIEAINDTKLSYLHLHAVDCQSWPLNISARLEYSSNWPYDPAQIETSVGLDSRSYATYAST